MKNSITGYSIANQILMSSYKGNYLIVEGPSDQRMFKKFVNQQKCKIISAQNKINAIKSIEILSKYDFNKVIAVIDADFMNIEEKKPDNALVFITDTHDIETLILKSDAFRIIIEEYCSEKKVKNFELVNKNNLKNILLNNGKLLGIFRFYCLQKGNPLKFKKLKIKECMNDKLIIKVNKMIDAVLKNSNKTNFSKNDKENLLLEIGDNNYDLWNICNGHDLSKILLIWMRLKLCRSSRCRNFKTMNEEDLEVSIRLSYQFEYFKETNLYKEIKKWEKSNGYQIFN